MSEIAFESERASLTRLAYQFLGSVADAEDMVQESFVRWEQAGRPLLEEPRAWFTTTCTRLCLDRLRAVQRERREYFGEWLPEPLVEGPGPAAGGELEESVSMALLVTIERLSPTERAAFLLHDVFGYGFREVAEVLGLKVAHCRQLAVRARRRLRQDERPRSRNTTELEALSEAFFAAISGGDVAGLERLLTDDVTFRSDGGGKAAAARRTLVGRYEVQRFLERAVMRAALEQPHELRFRRFNGARGAVVYLEGEPVSAFQFETRDGRISEIYVQRNPDKLGMFRGPG